MVVSSVLAIDHLELVYELTHSPEGDTILMRALCRPLG